MRSIDILIQPNAEFLREAKNLLIPIIRKNGISITDIFKAVIYTMEVLEVLNNVRIIDIRNTQLDGKSAVIPQDFKPIFALFLKSAETNETILSPIYDIISKSSMIAPGRTNISSTAAFSIACVFTTIFLYPLFSSAAFVCSANLRPEFLKKSAVSLISLLKLPEYAVMVIIAKADAAIMHMPAVENITVLERSEPLRIAAPAKNAGTIYITESAAKTTDPDILSHKIGGIASKRNHRGFTFEDIRYVHRTKHIKNDISAAYGEIYERTEQHSMRINVNDTEMVLSLLRLRIFLLFITFPVLIKIRFI